MARIAVVLAEDFEDSEFQVPYDRLRDEEHEVVVIGTRAGKELPGKKGRLRITTDRAIEDVDADEFDALVIPGGYSPDKLRTVQAVVRFVRAFAESGKPIAAICHGPSLLVEADVVRGKRVTSWPSIRRDLINAGALWEDARVVEDGNLVTSRRPDDLDAFCESILHHLEAAVAIPTPRSR